MDEKVKVFKLSREGATQISASNPVHRQELVTSPQAWMGVSHTMAGVASSWHHHSDNDTYGYVISGRLMLESGPGGKNSVEIGAGEAFHVARNVVHREVTPGNEPAVIFIVRVGTGESFVEVDRP